MALRYRLVLTYILIALCLLFMMVAAAPLAYGQSATFRQFNVTIIPDAADTTPGTLVFRGLRSDGSKTITLSAPNTIAANAHYRWPSTNTAGYMNNDGAGNLSFTPITSTSFPLLEVRLTDYGVANDCSTITNAAFTAALADVPAGGGILTIPPGCYLINDTITIGDGHGPIPPAIPGGLETPAAASTTHALTIIGAGSSNKRGNGVGTTIKWDPTAIPSTPKPMVKFAGPYHGGGIRDLTLDAAGTSNVQAVQMMHQTKGYFENVSVWGSAYTPAWEINTIHPTYDYGACLNTIINLNIDMTVGNGGGVLLDGSVPNRNSCSNVFINGHWWYDADNPSGYGLKLRYADNNSFIGVNLLNYAWPVGDAGGVVFEQYPGDTSFPKENQFSRVSAHVSPTGVSGTGGNTFLEYSADDCGGTFCLPSIANVKGFSKGSWFAHPTTPATILQNNNTLADALTLQLHQYGGGSNSAGAIGFLRTNDERARISADFFDGIVFSTKAGGALTPRWSISDAGTLFPWADNTYTIGSLTKRVAGFHSMGGQMYGSLELNNSNLSIKTSGGLQRAGFDINGFTLYTALGTPGVVATSASGSLAATNLGAINLTTNNVSSNLIPDGPHTLGNSTNRWEAWLAAVSANSVAVSGAITGASGSFTGGLSVGGTLTATTFAPSIIAVTFAPATISTTSLTTSSMSVSSTVNTDLIPISAGFVDLGSVANPWGELHTRGSAVIQYPGGLSLTNTAESTNRVRLAQAEVSGLNWGTIEVFSSGSATVTVIGLDGSVNAATFRANGVTGITGSCSGTVVYTGGIVTGCI